MNTAELLEKLKKANVRLTVIDNDLVLRGKKQLLSSDLLVQVREQKDALIKQLRTDVETVGTAHDDDQNSPDQQLLELTAAEMEQIATAVPGGADNVQDVYPLAPIQEGMLFHHLMGGEGDPYLVSTQYSFDRRDGLDSYVSALQSVIDRHDILRTAFLWEGLAAPVQVVCRHAPLHVEEVELSPEGGDAAEQLCKRFNPRHVRIDVRQAPLLRLYIAYDRQNDRWLMMQLLHHLVNDMTGTEVMRSEVLAYLMGEADRLPTPVPFRNLVAQARLRVNQQEEESFFRRMLADVNEPTAPFGLMDVQGDGTGIEEATLLLDAELAGRLRTTARRLRVSAATLCHFAWAQVMAQTSGRQDVVFGTVLFGRMEGGEGATRMMGPSINTLPVRISIGQEGVEASVRRVHTLLADLLRHEHASLALAQRCSAVPAPAPLFSALLNYRHAPAKAQAQWTESLQARLGMRKLRVEERTNYPITLSIEHRGDGFSLVAQVPAAIGPLRICEMMQTALSSLAKALETAPPVATRVLDILPASERQRVLYTWNDTRAAFPRDKCVHQLFEEQAERSPDATAVVFEEASLTYRALNERANQLAHHLLKSGVKPDARVAICAERSLEMVVGLMAILKAGGAYVPLDPAYPAERLRFMVEDAAPVALLTQHHLEERFSGIGDKIAVLDLAAPAPVWRDQPVTNPSPASIGLEPHHLAYVIYTSGSTGNPKGVLVHHRGVVNRLVWMQHAYGLTPGEAVLQKTPYSFDVSVWEFFWTLMTGARLVMARPEGHKDPSYLVETIRRNRVTTMHFVPSMLQLFLEHGDLEKMPSLLRVVCSGEALPAALLQRFQERLPAVALHNLYGPTEAAVDVTAWTAPAHFSASIVPIGKPVWNTQMYILDGHLEPVPMGIAGELYIGGVQVARGYLNRPELSAERFIPDPFAAEAGARMYRTGDLARWMADGNIEYLGRNDFQVKLRGFRIELGEIEARLAEHPAIREAAVIAREDTPGDKRLIAYYTSAMEDNAVGVEQLRAHLSANLPDYMVPAAFMRLETLPLTPNGKLDRKALPAPEADAFSTRGYEPPQGEMETELAQAWAEVLKVERVGRHDNFFDLGGHSLLGLRVAARLRQLLNVEVAIQDLFARPVLSELAERISNLHLEQRSEAPPIVPAVRRDRLPLSFAQQRLWFLSKVEDTTEIYHIPFGVRLKGRLNHAALRRALDRIVVRHEALRTTFALADGEPVQRIAAAEESHFRLFEQDLRGSRNAEAELDRLVELEARNPFDLDAGPLIRGRLIRLSEDEHALLMTMHHIVSDGWSEGVFKRELSALYSAFLRHEADPLPELDVQYADYAVWQRQLIKGEVLQRQADYWRKALAGAPTLLELPLDHPRPPVEDHAGAFVRMVLDEPLTSGLKELSRRNGTTLFMTLLAGWSALLARLSGQQDVLIGTPSANRGRTEIEDLIGFFVNTLVLRLDLSTSSTTTDLLKQAKTQALAAQQNQDIPFEQVVEVVKPVRSLAHSPLFQVMFAWQNNEREVFEFPGVEVQTLRPSPHVTAKFDMMLYLQESAGSITGGIEYATPLFEKTTVERYIGYFRTLLEAMVVDDTQVIDRLPIVEAAERNYLLHELNDTQAAFPTDKCAHQLFEEQAERTPDAAAVVFEEASLSYRALNERANQLAHHLLKSGVGPETLIGVCLERSLDMVVAILGILKAGGVYVPLDPSFPQMRLSQMVEDSRMPVLLTHRNLEQQLQVRPAEIIRLDRDWAAISNLSSNASGLPRPNGQNRAYVLYTSGSTGKPKGVEIPHSALVNFLLSMQREPGFRADDRLLAVTTLSFDIAGLEIYLPLITGGCVVIASREETHDPLLLMSRMRECGCTVMQATPATWRALIQAGWQGSPNLKVLCGGEALPRELAEELLTRCAELWNMYGPTETTIWSTVHKVNAGSGSVPIGKPIANTQLYILNAERVLDPIGVTGELYIGGAGLARGYLDREELTRERFVPNPFVPGTRMYRTGDLARRLADGSVECLGRVDNQVKLRGFRIELGEIEARLAEHPAIREAAVIGREDTPGDKRLIAYYTSAMEDNAVGVEQLRAHLSANLPDYMVPAAFMRLETLPLTPNGKLDRKALPAPEADAFSTRGYEPPQGEIETELAQAWAEVLKVERVGRHDNFFDLGGHSLLAVQLVTRLQKIIPGDLLQLRAFLEAPTVAQLANWIQNPKGSPYSFLVQVQPGSPGHPPLFYVAAPAATSLGMRALAMSLDKNIPLYCIQHKGLDGSEPFASIEEAARGYLEEVRKVQPHGPYHLGGFCFGCTVAFEMARILELSGESVPSLFLVDGFNEAYLRMQPAHKVLFRLIRFSVRRTVVHAGQIRSMPAGAWLSYTSKRLKALYIQTRRFVMRNSNRGQFQANLRNSELASPASRSPEQTIKRMELWGRVVRRKFMPQPYRGDAIVFRAGERYPDPYDNHFLGWRQVVLGSMESIEIDANHDNIFSNPAVRQISETISAKIRESAHQTEQDALSATYSTSQ